MKGVGIEGKNNDNSTLLYRYPGPSSFENNELSSLLFFGRREESDKLLHLILAEDMIVLYSYSGYGKTSLLNASVFPKLQAVSHIPHLIRFNKKEYDPLNDIKSQFSKYRLSKDTYISAEAEISKLVPVFVLDQFEELFTLEFNNKIKKDFFSSLAAFIRKAKEENIQVKFIISIREDYIGRLENLSAEIPAIFSNRFRLEALTVENAKEAILEPGRAKFNKYKFRSPSLSYSEEALQLFTNFLEENQQEDDTVFSFGKVDPIQLQIICRELEERVINGEIGVENQKAIIRKNHLADIGSILSSFYEKQLKKLGTEANLSRLTVRSLKKIVEKEMTINERRIPLDYHALTARSGGIKKGIDLLIKNRLLKLEEHREPLVEISHDSLLPAIIKSRIQATTKNKTLWNRIIVLALILVVFFLIAIPSYFKFKKQNEEIEKQNETFQQRLKAQNYEDSVKNYKHFEDSLMANSEMIRVLNDSLNYRLIALDSARDSISNQIQQDISVIHSLKNQKSQDSLIYRNILLTKDIEIDLLKKLNIKYQLKDQTNDPVKPNDSLLNRKSTTEKLIQSSEVKNYPERWFKKGYFQQFDNIKVLLLDIPDKNSITVEICDMIGATSCQRPLATTTIHVGQAFTVSDDLNKYTITLNRIGKAGNNPFALAAFVIFKKEKK